MEGHLLLIFGELDRNVDPASTMQVVRALQKAGKPFELMPIVGAGHGAAETPSVAASAGSSCSNILSRAMRRNEKPFKHQESIQDYVFVKELIRDSDRTDSNIGE